MCPVVPPLPRRVKQAELEMALRSQMEIIADSQRTGPFQCGPLPPVSGRSNRVSQMRTMGHLRPRARIVTTRRENEPHNEASGSDGECHGEDDEVRSLSLSEDGPVIRRSLSDGSNGQRLAMVYAKRGAAPDPIAMLTDGTRKASSRATASELRPSSGSLAVEPQSSEASHSEAAGATSQLASVHAAATGVLDVTDAEARGSSDGDALGSAAGSAQNDSDHSIAVTARANGITANAVEMASSAVDFKGLLPVLSKVTGHDTSVLSTHEKEQLRSQEKLLEVVQEGPGVAALAQGNSDPSPTYRMRTPVRPSARRSSNSVQALDLSQLTHLPQFARAANCSTYPVGSARSDTGSHVSFGSEHSAFTCWSTSSPNSSQISSPHAMPLKTTVSMPALTPR